jgi:hypothetical protein
VRAPIMAEDEAATLLDQIIITWHTELPADEVQAIERLECVKLRCVDRTPDGQFRHVFSRPRLRVAREGPYPGGVITIGRCELPRG